MNITFRTLFSLGLSFLMLAGASAQDIKIGVVDMKRIFAEYEKTKEAEREINDQKALAAKDLEEMTAKYKELLDNFQSLREQVSDAALSEQLRAQKHAESMEAGEEAKSLERRIQEYRTRREGQLKESVARMRENILGEILDLVGEVSKTHNYALVFDKSGMSLTGVPFLLHSRDAVDFSQEIIDRLNAQDQSGN